MARDSSFYIRYSQEIASAFSDLASEFEDRGTVWALEAVYDSVLKSAAVIKAAAMQAHKVFDEMAQKAKEQAPEGTLMIGIAEVDDKWVPTSFIGLHQEEGKDDAKAPLYEDNLAESDETPSEELISLLLLQSYIWSNRSWDKAAGKASDTMYGAMSHAKALFGPVPDFGITAEERIERLNELAKRFVDEDGNINLEIDSSKPPVKDFDENGEPILKQPLTAESAEFMVLLEQDRVFAGLAEAEQVSMQYGVHMPSCRSNLHTLMSESIATSLEASVASGKRFEEAFDEMVQRFDEKKEAVSAKAKSKWKKYLKSHPDAALAAKRKEYIVGIGEGGVPVFEGDLIPSLRENDIVFD